MNPTIVTDVPGLPPRPPNAHKRVSGHVAAIAGSRGMTGAAILTGLGALRGGAGLVRIYCPESVLPIIAAGDPSLMTVPLPEIPAGRLAPAARDRLRAEAEWPHALALGPGIGQEPHLPALIRELLSTFTCPLVVDADALNNLAAHPTAAPWWQLRAGRPTILTPHPGEMARLRRAANLPDLSGDDDDTRVRIAHEFAQLTGCTVILKGHRTVVSTAAQAYLNTTGNPGMATGGMGDVLTGFLAALLAQGLPPFDAARLAVYAHGLAGDLCARRLAPLGYLARELADALPSALAEASRTPMGFRA